MCIRDRCNINNIVLYLLLVVYIATILLIMGNEKRTRARKARSRAVDKKAIEEGKRRRRDGGSSSKSQEVEGTISAVLAGTMFKVKLANGHELLAHISGKMRKRFIRLVVGDKVKLEVSPYDIDKARITYRLG